MPRLMGHIALVAVGKLRTRHWQAAQAEYLERLHHYTNFKLVEVKDAAGRLPEPVARQREGEHPDRDPAGAIPVPNE